MAIRRSQRLSVKRLAFASTETNSPLAERFTQVSIQIRIPMEYREQPVISQMISDYGLTINIRSALLVTNTSGQFELELQGKTGQIQNALAYLDQLNLTTWIIG